MLWIFTWQWGWKYNHDYVEKLFAGVKRHLRYDATIILLTVNKDEFDDLWPIPKQDHYLLEIPGCLARLRLFDPQWQKDHGILPGDRIVCLDLDLVITGSLDPLFDREDDFTILQGVNAVNPNPFNGSCWMLKAGTHADVWKDFSIEAAEKLPHFAYSDDQDWMHHKIPNAAAWGPNDGVYGFQKPGWPKGDKLPSNARIVAFPGRRDPSQFTHLDWVKKHWVS